MSAGPQASSTFRTVPVLHGLPAPGDLRLLEPSLAAFLRSAGFTGFAIISRLDVYAGAPQHSSAAKFGTLGITFRARKPVPGEEEEPTQCALP